MRKKLITAIIALSLVLCCVVGVSLAWLMDSTQTVENTFTYGDINITLVESDADNDGNQNANQYKMIPGNDIEKDPEVSVLAGSEDCWLFVKIDKSENFDTFMTYALAEGWKLVDGTDNVYYREAKAGDTFSVLDGDKVTVKTSVTKDMLNAADFTTPTMNFTAYAVQKSDQIADAKAAWAIALNNGQPTA